MFGSNKKGKAKKTVRYDTLLSGKTEIHGDVKVTGGLHVDGTVIGNLIADHDSGATIRISETAKIEGFISAPNIIINGLVNGDVQSTDYLELAPKARVNGDVHYYRMEMVLGAEVNGQIHHHQDTNKAMARVKDSSKDNMTEPTLPANVDSIR